MSKFEPAVALVLKHEGGFVNDPQDPGGATNMGISLRFFRKQFGKNHTIEDIKSLQKKDAIKIYKTFFWDTQPYAKIVEQDLANRVFDLAVNMGARSANRCLQHAVNSCIGKHLKIDGIIGPITLKAVNSLDPDVLYHYLIIMAENVYEHLAKSNPGMGRFINGWRNRLHSTTV